MKRDIIAAMQKNNEDFNNIKQLELHGIPIIKNAPLSFHYRPTYQAWQPTMSRKQRRAMISRWKKR